MNEFWNFFLQFSLIVSLASLLGFLLNAARRRNIFSLPAAAESRLHCLLACACLLLPFLPSPLSGDFKMSPVKKLESAPTIKDFDLAYPPEQKLIISPKPLNESPFPLFAVLILACLLIPARDLFLLGRILKSSYTWKKIGRTRIAFSDQIQAPFSALWLGAAWVVLPSSLSSKPRFFKMILAHEIQHHRQKDTHWLYVFFLIRMLTPLNPLRFLWLRAVESAQEEACDFALVDQGRVRRREYSLCLLEIAETTVGGRKGVACAANFLPFSDGLTLKRRIEQMYENKKTNKALSWALALAFSLTLSAAAFASGTWVVDYKVNRAQAERMAAVAAQGTDFPVVVNDAVLRQLNRYLGTSQGRALLQEGMENMRAYRSILQPALSENRMPEEILALGMTESWFRNLPESKHPARSAGVWQFIPSTARNFGLQVDAQVDERLHVGRATDAAFRYLKANQLRFQDWALAVMAYNIGENALQKAIETHGTRNPWELLDRGVKTDPDYLPRFMALVLILKNPDVLK